jgi:2-hydroxychromene-2-carboxylate isomerase
VIGGLILVVVLALIIRMMSQPTPIDVDDPEQYGSVDVVFYVMSQCPYGTQVEDAIAPVLKELGSNINFRLDFIAQETSPGVFDSLHGPPEVEGNKIHLCVQENYPNEMMDFIVCQNKKVQDLKGTIDKCAEEAGIADAQKIKDCADGPEGNQLLSASTKASQEAGAQGSPTIYINNQLYSGARDATSFKRTICQGLEAHPVCENMPECGSDFDCTGEPGKVGVCENPGKDDAKCTYKDDAPVKLTVVNAKACTTCDATQLIGVLSQLFLNIEVEEVDVSSTKGRALVRQLNLQHAPSFVFTGDVDKTYAWEVNDRLRGAFRKTGDAFVLLDEASGASYLLDANKRAEMEKLIGVKKGDNRPQIDFYVMSYCPYGNIAEEAIEPAYQLLKDSADFNPHYVIYSNYRGGGPEFCLDDDDQYCSMHGVQELNQGLRELCVAKHIGMDEYFEFVLEMNKKCTYQNADTCWEPVAKSLNLDTAKIKDCEADEWEDILSKELALNKALGVSGSPTVFVEGAPYSGPRAASGYAQSLCAGFNTAPDECSAAKLASLGGAAPSPAASAGGCG